MNIVFLFQNWNNILKGCDQQDTEKDSISFLIFQLLPNIQKVVSVVRSAEEGK